MQLLPVCCVPYSSGWNPYLPSINGELVKLGVEFRKHRKDVQSLREMLKQRTIFHFHWPASYYATSDYDSMCFAVENWIEFLEMASDAYCPIVWTAHNIWPHECDFRDLHTIARRALTKAASHIITHCECAANDLTKYFDTPDNLSIIPHPCYEFDEIKDFEFQQKKAASNGLSMLCIGALRAYKNLEFVAEAFISCAGNSDSLVIVGPTHHSYDLSRLRAICARDNRIQLIASQIPETTLLQMLHDCDVVVLGYSAIMSSGAAVLAQSVGKPLIAPNLGCLAEWIPQTTGELYKANCLDSFSQAISVIRTRDLIKLGANAKQRISTETPTSFARKLHSIYSRLSTSK